jgi:hypothetical protein
MLLATLLLAGGTRIVMAESNLNSSSSQGEASTSQREASTNCKCYRSGTWLIQETNNFRILCRAAEFDFGTLGKEFEGLRNELTQKWLGKAKLAAWTPKCDVVLHGTSKEYLKSVPGGQQTAGSTVLEFNATGVAVRRVDVRADRAGWLAGALAHELTHVILADAFSDREIPRWADEGMAVLADPHAKRSLHLQDLNVARTANATFRVVEILTMSDYPQPERTAAFYGQSVSLVKFLVERGTPDQFVRFLRQATEQGYELALRETYKIDGVRALETQWLHDLASPARTEITSEPPRAQPHDAIAASKHLEES